MDKMDKKQEMPFTKSLVKQKLKSIMEACDNDSERDFLRELGELRQDVVYEGKYLSENQFDDMCQDLLDDLEKERK